ncbi:MAG: PKD domain-containing protein, partial [Anditalea sp.]
SITVSEPGLYRVLSVNDKNCSSVMSDGVLVEVIAIPTFRLANPAVVCEGEAVNLTRFIEGYDPASLDYEVEDPRGRKMKIEEMEHADTPGVYTVRAKDKRGDCWSPTEKLKVDVSEKTVQALFDYQVSEDGIHLPDADVLANSVIEFKDFSIEEVSEWHWDFGDGTTSQLQNPTHRYDQKGMYEVMLSVQNEYGCTSEMNMVIEIHDSYRIMIPNAFTPEGSKNTTFVPKHRGISAIKLEVFNTWGNLLYSTTKLEDSGWDGTVNGVMSPNGNYVYKVRFETTDGRIIDKAGVFLLIR